MTIQGLLILEQIMVMVLRNLLQKVYTAGGHV